MIHLKHYALREFLTAANVSFELLEHAPCRSSAESAAARASAGFPLAVGAKALVVVVGESNSICTIVLPGSAKLDSKAARKIIGRIRFASSSELAYATEGLEPGMVPPFVRPVFNSINNLYVDVRLTEYPQIGFNAACLDRSIVMNTEDYLKICDPYCISPLSTMT
jgi:Ala-tRNA(Pro) deacylase